MKNLTCCLLILFISSISYGEGSAVLSESQPIIEKQISTDESLSGDSEEVETVLDNSYILRLKGGVYNIGVFVIPNVTAVLEFQKAWTEKLKSVVLVGAGAGAGVGAGVGGLGLGLGLGFDLELQRAWTDKLKSVVSVGAGAGAGGAGTVKIGSAGRLGIGLRYAFKALTASITSFPILCSTEKCVGPFSNNPYSGKQLNVLFSLGYEFSNGVHVEFDLGGMVVGTGYLKEEGFPVPPGKTAMAFPLSEISVSYPIKW